VLHYLWRAVDQHGVVLDILVQEKRDGGPAKRFFKRLQYRPKRPITAGPRSHGVAHRALLSDVKHRISRYLNTERKTRIGRPDGGNS
jgi:putative transposase